MGCWHTGGAGPLRAFLACRSCRAHDRRASPCVCIHTCTSYSRVGTAEAEGIEKGGGGTYPMKTGTYGSIATVSTAKRNHAGSRSVFM